MQKNWSASLEHEDYENDVEIVINEAIEAVQQTAKGFYVNIVTPSTFGNPNEYLTEILAMNFGNEIYTKFIDQCGCGGYVLRVWKNK